MARFNLKAFSASKTVNLAGGDAYRQTDEMALASILLTSFVQDQFYRSAQETISELDALMLRVDPEFAAKAAIFARNEYGMRSITHVLAAQLAERASGKPWTKSFYDRIVKRPDDMLEIAGLVKTCGAKNLPNGMKKGFAAAFDRFDAYQLAKYRGEGKQLKLVDLVNLVHPTPNDRNREALRALVAGELKNTETWEAKLTAAGQKSANEVQKAEFKAEAWAEMLESGKMGYLAMLRNLRNIAEQAPSLVPIVAKKLDNRDQIRKALVMPFQFMVAMDAVKSAGLKEPRPLIEALTDALEMSLDNVPRFEGKTLVVIDDSGSMTTPARGSGFGSRSCIELGAVFAAAIFKSNDADLMRFSDNASFIKANPRDSLMTIADGIVKNAQSSGTNFHAIFEAAGNIHYDRIVILSDMQGWMGVGTPNGVFEKYKTRAKANPFVYSFDLAGHGSTQLPAQKVFCLAGFADKVFESMKMLESDRNALVSQIKAVQWN